MSLFDKNNIENGKQISYNEYLGIARNAVNGNKTANPRRGSDFIKVDRSSPTDQTPIDTRDVICLFKNNFLLLQLMKSPNLLTSDSLGLTFAMLLLRLWLGIRSLLTGIEKFGGTRQSEVPVAIDGAANSYGLTESSAEKVYSFSNYSGIPAALADKFAAEPLIPNWFLGLYDIALGPLLILLGLALLIGLASRIALFGMGLVYTSLSVGLILIKQDAGVAWLGIHILLVVAALVLSPYNRFQVLRKG